jgi:chromosome segregation ATPase
LNKLAMANVMTFQHLEKNMGSLKSLGDYIASMETFLYKTTTLSDKVNGLLDRTNEIELIAAEVRGVFEDNKKLQGFLLSHFQRLEEHSDIIHRSVTDSDNRMKQVVSNSEQVRDKLVGEIQEATASNVSTVKEKLISQYNELEKITLQNPQHFKKLEHLESVDKNLSSYLKTSTDVQSKMLKQITLTEKNVQSMNRQLATLKGGGSGYELLPSGIQRFIPAFELTGRILGLLTIVFVFIALIKYLFF